MRGGMRDGQCRATSKKEHAWDACEVTGLSMFLRAWFQEWGRYKWLLRCYVCTSSQLLILDWWSIIVALYGWMEESKNTGRQLVCCLCPQEFFFSIIQLLVLAGVVVVVVVVVAVAATTSSSSSTIRMLASSRQERTRSYTFLKEYTSLWVIGKTRKLIYPNAIAGSGRKQPCHRRGQRWYKTWCDWITNTVNRRSREDPARLEDLKQSFRFLAFLWLSDFRPSSPCIPLRSQPSPIVV